MVLKRSEAWKVYFLAETILDDLHDAQLDRLAEIIAENECENKATVIRKRKQNEKMRNLH